MESMDITWHIELLSRQEIPAKIELNKIKDKLKPLYFFESIYIEFFDTVYHSKFRNLIVRTMKPEIFFDFLTDIHILSSQLW